MIQPTEQAIRDRAYAIWEREGRPHGCDRDHWLQAAWELSGEQARAAAQKAGKAANKPEKPAARRRKAAGKRGKTPK